MSNKRTIILSIDNYMTPITLFDEFVKACENKGLVVRYEPYERDIFNELNLEALDIERNHTLTQLEEEILNNVACVGGSCED